MRGVAREHRVEGVDALLVPPQAVLALAQQLVRVAEFAVQQQDFVQVRDCLVLEFQFVLVRGSYVLIPFEVDFIG